MGTPSWNTTGAKGESRGCAHDPDHAQLKRTVPRETRRYRREQCGFLKSSLCLTNNAVSGYEFRSVNLPGCTSLTGRENLSRGSVIAKLGNTSFLLNWAFGTFFLIAPGSETAMLME
jgi:hypothetical protein